MTSILLNGIIQMQLAVTNRIRAERLCISIMNEFFKKMIKYKLLTLAESAFCISVFMFASMFWNNFQISLNFFPKGIDKVWEGWYNNQAVRESGERIGPWKLNNKRKYKADSVKNESGKTTNSKIPL